MNCYGSPLPAEQAATGLQQHTFKSISVEAGKNSVLQFRDVQSAITELAQTWGFVQENHSPFR